MPSYPMCRIIETFIYISHLYRSVEPCDQVFLAALEWTSDNRSWSLKCLCLCFVNRFIMKLPLKRIHLQCYVQKKMISSTSSVFYRLLACSTQYWRHIKKNKHKQTYKQKLLTQFSQAKHNLVQQVILPPKDMLHLQCTECNIRYVREMI